MICSLEVAMAGDKCLMESRLLSYPKTVQTYLQRFFRFKNLLKVLWHIKVTDTSQFQTFSHCGSVSLLILFAESGWDMAPCSFLWRLLGHHADHTAHSPKTWCWCLIPWDSAKLSTARSPKQLAIPRWGCWTATPVVQTESAGMNACEKNCWKSPGGSKNTISTLQMFFFFKCPFRDSRGYTFTISITELQGSQQQDVEPSILDEWNTCKTNTH